MAFTDCPECRLEISDRAATCPRCGFPMNPDANVRYVSGLTALEAAKSIVGRVILGAVIFAGGVTWEAPPVILSSLVLFGSTIPVWLKARRFERLRSGAGVQSIRPPENQQLLASQARPREHQAELDRAALQVEDLQERLEFLERLVAKRQQGVD